MASEHERWQQGDSDAQCKLMRPVSYTHLTDDAELKRLVERAKGLLSGVSAKDLKTAAELRTHVRAGMDDIAAQLDTMIVRKGARKFRLED